MSNAFKRTLVAGFVTALVSGCGTQASASKVAAATVAVDPQQTGSAVNQGIASIAWLSGSWRSQQGGTTMEVYYSTPKARTILGLMRMTTGEQVSFFEFERIAEDAGTLVLSPSPNGVPGVSFKLVSLSGASAVFENSEHAFPRRITLEVADNDLHMKIEGRQNDQDVAQEFVMPRT